MANATPLAAIAKWYSGKALTVIRDYVIPTLTAAEAQGFWPKGTSRKVRAALNKQTIAIKFARANEGAFGRIAAPSGGDHWTSGRAVAHAMMFGAVADAPTIVDLIPRLMPLARHEDERAALAKGAAWAADFAPVAALLQRLDATRPKPVVVLGTLSPTVVANLGAQLGIAFASIESPPVEWIQITVIVKGITQYHWRGRILWPTGTRHGQSRFACGTDRNAQCHACGHAIKSGIWVPLVARTATHPVSLFVGRDCARKLFGCDVSGEGEYEGAPGIDK